MKYPIGTKCWVVATDEMLQKWRGAQVSVVAHDAESECPNCNTVTNMVRTDARYLGIGIYGCCVCTLVPIDDPDAKTEVTEHEAIEA